MKKILLTGFACAATCMYASAQSFTSGNLAVLQTSGTASKASSAMILKEFSTSGVAGITVTLPVTGPNPIQTSGVFGGSEGFLTTSTDGKYLMVGGYKTPDSYSDITGTTSSSVPRVVGTVAPSGFYLQVGGSSTFYSANDIRGAVSDGTDYWAAGASVASVDGINYYGPGTPAALAGGTTPPKAYGIRIFNGQIYFSTQKAGPTNTSSQLGIFALGTGKPTSGTVTVSQVINMGTVIPQDFSFNSTTDVCYVAVSLNTSAGGIQKWTKSGTVWSLAYTLGTGATNIGAYGLVVDYSGTFPVIYATTFETAGNRVIKITDNGASATATTLVAATTNAFYKGITFTPNTSGTPVVNLTVSTDTASEAGSTVVTIKANSSFAVTGSQTVSLAVTGSGITSGDYTLSGATVTIASGATSGSATFTVKDDILGEGTEVAAITMKSPSSGIVLGIDTVKTITIADNDGNNHPTIKMNTDSTSNYIDAGITSTVASPFKLSAAINDPTDPGSSSGVVFTINDLETADTDLIFTAKSSNTTVVPVASLLVTGKGAFHRIKIVPAAVGYSNITVMVSDGIDSTTFVLNYAASAASVTPSSTYWHTGMSDGSDAIALDDNYYVSGDDELNILNFYSRKASGLPLLSYNYTSMLSLPDPAKPEVDVEAAALSPVNAKRIYWLGSMSNGKAPFDNKPNRDRIFAIKITGTVTGGIGIVFSTVGYAALKSSIVSWGDANGYGFTASTAAGVDSKLPSGFAAEGMVFGPDSTTLYIGLRAPLVPVTVRKNALIVPVKDFETWFNNGAPSGSPVFGAPIELNLGGKGIRDITRMSNGTYIIVAGNVGGSPVTGALYKWTGNAADTPVLVPSPSSDTLNMEGVMEVNTGGPISSASLQVISDKGDDVLYADGIAAKDFSDLIYRKFRSDILSSLDLSMPPPTGINTPVSQTQGIIEVYPNPSYGLVNINFYTQVSEAYKLSVTDINGRVVFEKAGGSEAGANKVIANMESFSKGLYLIHLTTSTSSYIQKLLVK